jgi:predicted dehydrogenase
MPGVAVVGTGYWGRNHVRTFRELKAEGVVDSLIVCDVDPDRAGAVGREFEVGHATDYRAVMNDAEVQAVSIATPSRTHYGLAKEFMQAGKDVLVEKPMTLDVGEAEELVETAHGSGRILMAGHVFRYHPAVCELKRRVDAGELGEVVNLVSNRMHYGVPRRDMGVIHALGVHELDLFCHLMGVELPSSVLAAESKSYSQGTEETAIIFMDFGTAKGYAFESWLMAPYGKKRDLTVVGRERTAWIDYLTPQELHLLDKRMAVEDGLPVAVEDDGRRVIPVEDEQPLKEELRHFVACVESRAVPLTDGAVGLRAVRMAEAALESAATGKAVHFDGAL